MVKLNVLLVMREDGDVESCTYLERSELRLSSRLSLLALRHVCCLHQAALRCGRRELPLY